MAMSPSLEGDKLSQQRKCTDKLKYFRSWGVNLFLGVAFVTFWVGIDYFGKRLAPNVAANPWYPQIAASLVFYLIYGWKFLPFIILGKLVSSLINWPGPVFERVLPNLSFALGIVLSSVAIRKILGPQVRSPLDLSARKILECSGAVAVAQFVSVLLRNFSYSISNPEHYQEGSGLF